VKNARGEKGLSARVKPMLVGRTATRWVAVDDLLAGPETRQLWGTNAPVIDVGPQYKNPVERRMAKRFWRRQYLKLYRKGRAN